MIKAAPNNMRGALFLSPPDLFNPLTVAIIDDDAPSRSRLKFVLNQLAKEDQIQLCIHEFGSVPLAEELKRIEPDLILLDKYLDGQDGVESIPQILSALVQCTILVVSSDEDSRSVQRALALGASGFVPKDVSNYFLLMELRSALEQRLKTQHHLPNSLRQQLTLEEIMVSGTSVAVAHLQAIIDAAAESARPVLLEGLPGSGAFYCAYDIHKKRARFLQQSKRPLSLIYAGQDTNEKDIYSALIKGGSLMLILDHECPENIMSAISRSYNSESEQRAKLIIIVNDELCFNKILRSLGPIISFEIKMPNVADRLDDVDDICRNIANLCAKKLFPTSAVSPAHLDFCVRNLVDLLRNGHLPLNALFIEAQCTLFIAQRLKLVAHTSNPLKSSKSFISDENPDSVGPLPVLTGNYNLDLYIKKITRDIYAQAAQRFRSNKDIAHALGVSEATVSIKLREYGLRAGQGSNSLHNTQTLSHDIKDNHKTKEIVQ